MKVFKKIVKAVIAVLAVLAVIFGIYYFAVVYQPYTVWGIQKKPGAQLIKSLNLTMTTYANNSGIQLPAAIRKSLNAGSVDIQIGDGSGNIMHNKIYLRKNGLALLGSTVAEDKSVSDNYGMWVTEDVLIGHAPMLLQNDAYYGVNFKTLKDDIKDSALLEATGMTYEEFCQMWDAYTGEKKPSENENAEKLLQNVSEIMEIIKNCPVSVSEAQTAVSDNEAIAVYRIAYTFTPDKICQVLELLQEMEPELPVKEDAVVKPMSLAEEAPQKSELELLQEEIMRTNATAVIEFDLHTSTQMVVAAKCRIDWLQDENAGTFSASILLGKSPNALTQEARLTTIMPGQDKEEIIITLTKSNAHNMPGRKLTMTSKGKTATLLDFQYNTVTHTFEAELMDREIILSGSCITDDAGVFTVTIDSNEETTLALVFNPEEKTPALPAYTNLCDLTYEELEDLANKLEPEQDFGEKYVEIAIYGADGSVGYMAFWHDYETLAELLVAEGCAELDANGRIRNVYIFGEKAEGDAWTVTVLNIETDGFTTDIPLSENEQVEIFGQYGKFA